MSKLIGTNPNQVPSNADLGTAAFMDKKEFLLSKGSEMSAIDAVISKTAVDVFIYDTTKDSDGGAWRKRTQHTSWYNEKLNTTTRGSRKEFPAVAVIIAETTKVTIYDVDDINMPMWMVFNSGANTMLPPTTSPPISVTALNGDIAVGTSNGGTTRGVGTIKFALDGAYWWRSTTATFAGNYSGGIVNRNLNSNYDGLQPTRIVNNTVNDVAMTVLPNAPIDSATGLPVPTIAVATDGGVSVIKDDGTVVDLTSTNATYTNARTVDFTDDGKISYAPYNTAVWYISDIPTADQSYAGYNGTSGSNGINRTFYSTGHGSPALVNLGDNSITNTGIKVGHTSDGGRVFTNSKGVNLLKENVTPSKGSVAYITSDYNTGWMNGDIKLAALSDTDTTNAVGTDFVTNGNFSSSDLSSFSPYNSGTLGASIAVVGGELKLTHTGTTNYAFATFSWAAEIGQVYRVSCNLKNGNASYAHFKPHSGCIWNPSDHTHSGTSYEFTTHTVTATATTAQIRLQLVGSNGQYAYFDNVSVTKAEHDRSVKNNSLQVYGTVTKTAVATGAELVAYSGFSSSSNLLKQPNNSNLDIGSDDFCVTLWTKITSLSSTQMLWSLANPTVNNNRTAMYVLANGDARFFLRQSSAEDMASSGAGGIVINNWTHVCVMRKGNTLYIYINGEMKASVATSKDITQVGKELKIGADWDGSVNANASSLALFRFSATAPSEEQIAKMYNDEKHLFQENAKATLYGTSNAVTALAYDDDKELLHVGTSAGRSDFQGLRRVNNTTRAIGTAISAVDGFIVEE